MMKSSLQHKRQLFMKEIKRSQKQQRFAHLRENLLLSKEANFYLESYLTHAIQYLPIQILHLTNYLDTQLLSQFIYHLTKQKMYFSNQRPSENKCSNLDYFICIDRPSDISFMSFILSIVPDCTIMKPFFLKLLEQNRKYSELYNKYKLEVGKQGCLISFRIEPSDKKVAEELNQRLEEVFVDEKLKVLDATISFWSIYLSHSNLIIERQDIEVIIKLTVLFTEGEVRLNHKVSCSILESLLNWILEARLLAKYISLNLSFKDANLQFYQLIKWFLFSIRHQILLLIKHSTSQSLSLIFLHFQIVRQLQQEQQNSQLQLKQSKTSSGINNQLKSSLDKFLYEVIIQQSFRQLLLKTLKEYVTGQALTYTQCLSLHTCIKILDKMSDLADLAGICTTSFIVDLFIILLDLYTKYPSQQLLFLRLLINYLQNLELSINSQHKYALEHLFINDFNFQQFLEGSACCKTSRNQKLEQVYEFYLIVMKFFKDNHQICNQILNVCRLPELLRQYCNLPLVSQQITQPYGLYELLVLVIDQNKQFFIDYYRPLVYEVIDTCELFDFPGQQAFLHEIEMMMGLKVKEETL